MELQLELEDWYNEVDEREQQCSADQSSKELLKANHRKMLIYSTYSTRRRRLNFCAAEKAQPSISARSSASTPRTT